MDAVTGTENPSCVDVYAEDRRRTRIADTADDALAGDPIGQGANVVAGRDGDVARGYAEGGGIDAVDRGGRAAVIAENGTAGMRGDDDVAAIVAGSDSVTDSVSIVIA